MHKKHYHYPNMSNQNQYDFIINEEKKYKAPSKKGKNNGSSLGRIGIVLGGLFGLIVVGMLLFMLFTSGSDSTGEKLITISAKQTEIVRIASLGANGARTSTGKNYATTVRATIQADLTTTQGLITKSGVKVDPALISAAKNTKTDQLLNAASQNNKFDEVFIAQMNTLLTSYQADLQKLYKETGNKATKNTLQTLYKNAGALTQATKDGASNSNPAATNESATN